MPKPVVRAVPKGGGETIMLPILKNEKGEPILDQEGKTILMGDGGISDFTNFTTEDGLALDGVRCSMMDKFGNLWFGTERGVSRFDGKSFTNYTTAHGLTNSTILTIFQDKFGNLWFGTQQGVSRYDGKSFTNFATADSLNLDFVVTIIEDKAGNIWFGTIGNGAMKFDGQNFTSFTTKEGLASNNTNCILVDKAGNVWFGGGGLSRYNGESFATYTATDGFPRNYIFSMHEDKKGNIWFGTNAGIICQSNSKFSKPFKGENMQSINKILEDNQGNLWFTSFSEGVKSYDGKSLKHFTTTQGLTNPSVLSITEDKVGSIWFGTFGGGVSRYNGKAFTFFSKIYGLPGSLVYSLTEDKTGNLWLGTFGGGVSRFDGKSFTTFLRAQGLSDALVTSTIEDKFGNFWFGTSGNGVYRFDGKLFTNFSTVQGLTSNNVSSMLLDKIGNLWIGTFDAGVSRYDGESFTNYTTAQGLAQIEINTIFQDNFGKIWLGTNGGGVSLYDGKSLTNFTTDHGLANNMVISIFEDLSGNLWFGTEEGLSFLDSETYKELFQVQTSNEISDSIQVPSWDRINSTVFRSFRIADGLSDDIVIQILQMPNGKMAIGTYLGINIFNISEDGTLLTDFEKFESSTGYPVKDVNFGKNALLLDSKGIIWAGTGSEKTGLVRFDYEALNKNVEAPVLVIQSIKVKDEKVSWHTLKDTFDNVENEKSNLEDDTPTVKGIIIPPNVTEEVSLFGRELRLAERDSMRQRFGKIEFDSITPFYPLPQNLLLPYNLNQVSFEFVAIETSRPQMVKYQYQLEGYDEDWSPLTNRSNASFGNIQEGSYTFKVKAQGANGMWTAPVSYSFTVLPPWYRSWWAYGIYALFLVGLVWRIHLIQKARTLRIEREKTKDKELAQAKEIEKAYGELGKAHQTLKSTQAQLIQSEKMASLGELTAGIAHEIQNPLNFVNNFSEVSSELLDEMNEELEKGDIDEAKFIANDIKQNLDKINHHGKRADAIVKGMLEHSRISSGEKVSTDINALADEYLRLSYHGMRAKDKSFNADFVTDFDPTLPKINLVPQEIGRVLLNIINNAFQAFTNSEFSQDSYRDHNSELKPLVTVSTMKNGDNLEIRVSDNGPGIPDSIKTKIFQPFFTTKPTGLGTGLGLSLSYDIVKAHGGEIKVDSQPGLGTTFIILLPTY
ncbi:two-component regulator propeller domain-containing protein [Cognataquiflexum aquatile]|uniref:two-component regulator propeller domain-containing protein n=1 Tax=Cognataquiflexum aquatile TaxID=2249427 RepID=UPI001E44F770|nr:two-component regulator propeller domain-containing protein [Cognataquiflexum aquatile]